MNLLDALTDDKGSYGRDGDFELRNEEKIGRGKRDSSLLSATQNDRR